MKLLISLRIMALPVILVSVLGFASGPQEKERSFYHFKTPTCDTGKHLVEKQALCQELKDNKKNNNCAETERRESFSRLCSSERWS